MAEILVVGGGNMGEALAMGMVNSAYAKIDDIIIAEPLAERAEYLRETSGFHVVSDGAKAAPEADKVVICREATGAGRGSGRAEGRSGARPALDFHRRRRAHEPVYWDFGRMRRVSSASCRIRPPSWEKAPRDCARAAGRRNQIYRKRDDFWSPSARRWFCPSR